MEVSVEAFIPPTQIGSQVYLSEAKDALRANIEGRFIGVHGLCYEEPEYCIGIFDTDEQTPHYHLRLVGEV